EKKLEKLSPVDFTQVNNSIFNFIESKNYGDEQKKSIPQNLEKYIDFMSEKKSRETFSHFISLISAKNFPETLFFISSECKSVYRKIFEAL
ncbi:MAG: hypothetical protein II563_05715, partial [Treponema sp.]|nr:hypothetical protein [Treponema sp.]